MLISELRSEFYKKVAADGRVYKTLINRLHAKELLARGWERIGPADYVNLVASIVFYGPDGKLLSL